jgi:hypothetical protein
VDVAKRVVDAYNRRDVDGLFAELATPVREGTHCVTPPVVSGSSRPDSREATHEKRPCNDPARDLSRDRQRLALTRGHRGHGIEARWPTAAPSYLSAVRGAPQRGRIKLRMLPRRKMPAEW